MKTIQKIIDSIQENIHYEKIIEPEMDLTKDMDIDSIELMMIMYTIEEKFSIEIEVEYLNRIKTVKDIAAIVDLLVINQK